MRHALSSLRRASATTTRLHAKLVLLSGGRIRRSFLFAGGMPILVLTTTGRRSGEPRSTPIGYLALRDGRFAVLASNAGSDRPPAWWLNLHSNPTATVLAEGRRVEVTAATASPEEAGPLWEVFARRNPGFDEYRRLTHREIPVVLLQPVA